MKPKAPCPIKWAKKNLIEIFVFIFLLIVCIGAAVCACETVQILGVKRFIEVFLFNLCIQCLYRFCVYCKRKSKRGRLNIVKNNVVVYDCVGAYYAGVRVNPVTQMRKLGYNIISSTGSAMFNIFRFEVEKIIEPLPPYLRECTGEEIKSNA